MNGCWTLWQHLCRQLTSTSWQAICKHGGCALQMRLHATGQAMHTARQQHWLLPTQSICCQPCIKPGEIG